MKETIKKVQQLVLDIMVETGDANRIEEEVVEVLKKNNYKVLSSSFTTDVTDKYKLFYPELSKRGFRTIKFIAGMVPEFEIISTNAPNSVIKANMQYINTCEENGEKIDNPYAVIESMGYIANCLGCQDDFDEEDLETAVIDECFDYNDM